MRICVFGAGSVGGYLAGLLSEGGAEVSVIARGPHLAAIKANGNRASTAVTAMLEFSERFDLGKYGWPGAPLHDPCVMAYLIDPALFHGRHVNVSIETGSELTVGMTVADYWSVTGKAKNCTYLRSANSDGFYALLTERLKRLP